MSEVEEEVDETTEVQDQDQDIEISYEEALEWKKKAERLEKAEARIVELKKQQKIQKTEVKSEGVTKEEIQKIIKEQNEELDFYRNNADALAYKDKIDELKKEGLSLKRAYLIASAEDKEIEANREVYGKSVVSGDEAGAEGFAMLDMETYDGLSEADQNAYNEKSVKKYGKIKMK